MNDRERFYHETVDSLIKDKSASVLVCGGGERDKNTLENLKFSNVTISNLDERMEGEKYAPYAWSYENAEQLSFADMTFDYVIIHEAIHHSSLPHKVLSEMYRVAKIAVLAIESRDSLVMRFLERFELTQTYEHAAVYYSDCLYGGVNNTEIPNYIYRWTEREIEKTIMSYSPYAKDTFIYRYGLGFPSTPQLGKTKNLILKISQPFFWLFTKLFPKQQNLFAFYIEKTSPRKLFPWLIFDTDKQKITFNKPWANEKYNKLF